MRLWAGLFVFAFSAALLVVLGKSVQWMLPLTIPSFFGLPALETINLAHLVNGAIAFSVPLLTLRILTIFGGIRSLAVHSADIAIGEAQGRDMADYEAIDRAIEAMPKRPDFGKRIDLPG